MATDDALIRRSQPGTQNAVTYPQEEIDVTNGWRIYSGPAADEFPIPTEVLPWVTQIVEEVPF
jgi:hypothetical protein